MPPRFTFTFNKQGKLKEETETLETIKQSHDIIHISEDEIDEDDLPTDEPDVVAKPETKKSRKGRPIKTPHHIDDFVAGSELDNLNLRSEKDDDFTSRARITSSPPYLVSTERRQTLRLRNVAPQATTPPCTDFLSDITPDIYDILSNLQSSPETHIDLPSVFTDGPPATNDPDVDPEDNQIEVPYTALLLTQIYLLAHNARSWNICDLIADTWIRAFHAQRTKGQKDARMAIWRPNRVLERRMAPCPQTGRPDHFDANAPEYDLSVNDPALEHSVVGFNIELINVLFNNTPTDCGARRLWADALTLTGDRAGDRIEMWRRQGVLHKDLENEVLATSLRMVRRNLTLKIEEVTEGAYCRRYHEHARNGMPCYRQMAWRERMIERERGTRDAEGETDDDVAMVGH